MRKLVREAEKLPRGYGISYRDFSFLGAICYPIPINWIVRFLIIIRTYLRFPGDLFFEKKMNASYQRGLENGKDHSYQKGFRAGYLKRQEEFDVFTENYFKQRDQERNKRGKDG